jgi:hypothetical protein
MAAEVSIDNFSSRLSRRSVSGGRVRMSPRKERAIRNQALFREVNSRIAELEGRISISGEPLPLVCECANTGCTTPIEVDPATFHAMQGHPHWFVLAPGHEQLEVETVIERRDGYLIVEAHDASEE